MDHLVAAKQKKEKQSTNPFFSGISPPLTVSAPSRRSKTSTTWTMWWISLLTTQDPVEAALVAVL